MGRGEIADWDLEAGTRTAVVWPDNSPPLSYQDEVLYFYFFLYTSFCFENDFLLLQQGVGEFASPKLTTTSLFAYPNVDGSSLLMACGDTEGNINFWDTQNVKQSYTVSTIAGGETPTKNRVYKRVATFTSVTTVAIEL